MHETTGTVETREKGHRDQDLLTVICTVTAGYPVLERAIQGVQQEKGEHEWKH